MLGGLPGRAHHFHVFRPNNFQQLLHLSHHRVRRALWAVLKLGAHPEDGTGRTLIIRGARCADRQPAPHRSARQYRRCGARALPRCAGESVGWRGVPRAGATVGASRPACTPSDADGEATATRGWTRSCTVLASFNVDTSLGGTGTTTPPPYPSASAYASVSARWQLPCGRHREQGQLHLRNLGN